MIGKVRLFTGSGALLSDRIFKMVGDSGSTALAVASAYLSLEGAEFIGKIQEEHDVPEIRVVAGLSGAVTDPNALEFLEENDIKLRVASHSRGIFHPKLLIAGKGIEKNSGSVVNPSCGYVGSGNFTGYGLRRNVEIGFFSSNQQFGSQLAARFSSIWIAADAMTSARLAAYRQEFSRRMRNRSSQDLVLLEIGRSEGPSQKGPKRGRRLGTVVSADSCSAVWVGLESITGEHRLQVEFPRPAAEALQTLLGQRDGRIDIECVDGQIRSMKYAYYMDNGMYRLNLPNDVPLAEWVRQTRRGALLISRPLALENSTNVVTAEIVRGPQVVELRRKSELLGTLGSTVTREYGWF